jgi:membrane-bound ClpP family serine protease
MSALALFGVVLKKLMETRRMKPRTGVESLVGRMAEVRPGGMVFVEGALWTAPGSERWAPGTKVRVVEIWGTSLNVEKEA